MKHLKYWDRLKWHRGIPHDRLDWFVLDVTLRKHSDLEHEARSYRRELAELLLQDEGAELLQQQTIKPL